MTADSNSTFSDKLNTDFTSEIGPFWLEIVGYQISVLSRLSGPKKEIYHSGILKISGSWVVTDKE